MGGIWEQVARWTAAPPPERALFALLVAGHMLGDFVLQSRALVEAKRTSLAALLRHAGQVTLAHLALAAPFLRPASAGAVVAAVAALGLAHLLIDRWKMRVESADAARGVGPRLRWWSVDQLLHLASVVAAWRLALALARAGGDGGLAFALPDAWLGPLTAVALATAVFAFNVHGASAIVAAVLDACERRDRPRTGPTGADPLEGVPRDWTLARESKAKKGAVIGVLERGLLIVLVWLGAYGALGFVLAAKSVARFKDLEERDFSEGYLVGTLCSTSIALVSGLALAALLGAP